MTEDQIKFQIDIARNYYRDGMVAYLNGLPLDSCSALSEKSGWRDAKKMQLKRD